MMIDSGWKELKTLQEVAAAQAAGEEIEWRDHTGNWWTCDGKERYAVFEFRSRPKKRTETIVLREALVRWSGGFEVKCLCEEYSKTFGNNFVCWLDTPAREIEVEE